MKAHVYNALGKSSNSSEATLCIITAPFNEKPNFSQQADFL